MVVRAGGLEPPRDKPDEFSYPLRLSPPPIGGRLWSGLSLHRAPEGLGAARLVSTPSRSTLRAWLGIPRVRGFPEFEQFCTRGFPRGTQFWPKSVASTGSATPAQPRPPIECAEFRAKEDMSSVRKASIWLPFTRPAGVDRIGIDHVLDVGSVEFLDHLDTGPAVFSYLINMSFF